MSRSDETLYRQWVMLTKIPRFPRRISVPELKAILIGEGYTVDTRTVQRDLNKLSISFPLSNETLGRKNYWFWIEDAAIHDLPGMEPVTALAFEMAKDYLTPLLPQATLDLLLPYFENARKVLGEQSQSLLRNWSEKIEVIERGPVLKKPVIDPLIQQTIYQALLEEKAFRASYTPRGESDSKEYIIHPQGIVSRMGVIYLLCTLWDYDDIKQFALHRFKQAEIIEQPAKIKPDFSLQAYIEQDKQFAYRIEDEPIQLKVLFDAQTAAHLAETPLSDSQTLTPQPDGRVLLEAEVMHTLELRWWLQGFGDNVEVLAPKSMRDKFVETIKQLNRQYKINS